jgi:predicted metal-binding membrane protein
MMISAADDASAGHPAGAPRTVRRFLARHPEWWALAAAAAAWAMMVALPHPDASHAGHHGHAPSAGPGALAMAAMVVAMMLPMAIPGIRHAASSSRERRQRAVTGYVMGYLAVWLLAMPAIAAGWTRAASLAGWTAAAAGTVAFAALWEALPLRHRLAHRCRRTVPLARHGWRADADCARYGATSGVACVGTCWALMAACVAFAHSLPVMVVLFGVQMAGRYGRSAPALAAAAVLVAGLAAVVARIAAGHGA